MESIANKRCENCQKQFPEDRIDLHEAYCRRNFKKCQLCESFIDINQHRAHQEQFHTKKPCEYCKADLYPQQIASHMMTCRRRPKTCVYCQTEIASDMIAGHEISCGARTKLCAVCNQNIMLKDFNTHETRCRQPQFPPIPNIPRGGVSPVLPPQNRNIQRMRSRQRERERVDRRSRERENTHIMNYRGQHSLSAEKNNVRQYHRTGKEKYDLEIPLCPPKPMVNIIPISVQITIDKKQKLKS